MTMEFKIKKQEKNPLLYREEFMIEITSKNNPTKEEVLAFLKKDPELCVLQEILGNYGRDKFMAGVFVYDSIEAKEKTEYIPMKVRKKLEEIKKKKAEEEAKKKAAEEEAKRKAEEEAAKAKEEVKGETENGN